MSSQVLYVERFSTSKIPRRQKVDYWRNLCCQKYSPLDLEPGDSRNFEGMLARTSIGAVNFCRLSSSPGKIVRSERHMESYEQHQFYLFWYAEGGGRFIQRGSEIELNKGDFVLLDLAQPYQFEFDSFCSTVSMELPESILKHYLPKPEELLLLPMRSSLALNRMVGAMIECMFDRVVSEGQDSNNATLTHSLMDVIVSAYGSSGQVKISSSTVASSRRLQIKRYIEANLADSDLGPARIAAHNHVSPRYLRYLFNEEGETVSRYVLRRRLEECARRLREPAWQGTNIIDIAFSWGFKDMAHFGRSFREYFGLSPREYRRGG